MNPYISVIITVYNRTQYVNDAINSVLNQTLDKDKYEIIVVTNIDIPEREGVKIIKSNEKWLGPKIAEGIENAKGEVISLLEDDDMFLPNKLEIVYSTFRENPNLGLFKNPMKVVYENKKVCFYPMPDKPIYLTNKNLTKKQYKEIEGKYKLHHSASSLSFRKFIIENYIEHLKKIKLSPDVFFAFLYLAKSDIMIWNKPLSIFRFLLDSASHNLIDIENFIKARVILTKVYYEDINTLYNIVKDNQLLKSYLEQGINFAKIRIKAFSNNVEINLSFIDVLLNTRPIDNPNYPRIKIIIEYLFSLFPYSLKNRFLYSFYYAITKRYLIYRLS